MPALPSGPDNLPPLPWTISVAARQWKMSRSVIAKHIARGTCRAERRGGGATRAATILIWQTERPKPAPRGSLTPDQRAAWNRGRRKSTKASG